ncbi:hypothetical protein CDD83_10611 [Cordyceps sp. RAO-2017]|nr:hypothetical protein CDD83_10611 [Cordyceps sp. RAO-2017]
MYNHSTVHPRPLSSTTITDPKERDKVCGPALLFQSSARAQAMPRKFKTPESVAQNREHQRQSRARRKALVNDLKRRLDEYERRGCTASLEIQAVARAVHAENRQLRVLLELYGVSGDQVDSYLASHLPFASGTYDAGPRTKACGTPAKEIGRAEELHDLSKTWNKQSQLPRRRQQRRQSHRKESALSEVTAVQPSALSSLPSSSSSPCSHRTASAMQRPQLGDRPEAPTTASTESPLASVADSSDEGECESDAGELLDWQDRAGQIVDAARARDADASFSPLTCVLPSVPEYLCPRQPSVPDLDRTDSLETSCDVAAAILIQLHNQADSAAVRVALGCAGASSCSVKNTRIFQLMDQLG